MLIQEALGKNQILQKADVETQKKLISCGHIKKYKKGELIFREREEVLYFFFLAEGYVALYRINKNQDRKVIFVYGNHDMLNEVIVQEPVASITCMALSEVRVLTFYRDEFRDIMEKDAGLTNAVMDSVSLKLRRCYRQLANTPNAMSLDDQLSSKLWKLGRDFGKMEDGKIRIQFDLTITFLADMVGAKRETVSRAVKRFKERKLIEYEKNTIWIMNLEALRCFDTEG